MLASMLALPPSRKPWNRPLVAGAILAACLLAGPGATGSAQAQPRTATARIDRVETAVATLQDVRVRLHWVPGASSGQLLLDAGRVDAVDLGYHYRNLRWSCPLRRLQADRWQCDGELRSGGGPAFRLAVDLGSEHTRAQLARGAARIDLRRDAATPELTSIDLTRVPLAWAQALLAQAWPDGQLQGGRLDGGLRIRAPDNAPLQVEGGLDVADAALDTPDASVAAQGIDGHFDIGFRTGGGNSSFDVSGRLRGGEFLAGNTYVALPESPVTLEVEGESAGEGWRLPRFAWRDGDVLVATGSAGIGPGASLQSLQVDLRSEDVAPLRDRYLSGWLGLAGLADMEMSGALEASLHVADGALQSADALLHDIDLVDAKGRFRFDDLAGHPRLSAGAVVTSDLRWGGGQVYGLDFEAASLPLASGNGELHLREAVAFDAFGGSIRFDGLEFRPPRAGAPMRLEFSLGLDRLDIGMIAKALDLPEFTGELSGDIPSARYEDGRLVFDGGLGMQLFGGTVEVSQLALERPFGVAPSLSADLVLDDIDMYSLTGVFDFGSISGKLDGRVDGLRLVDWTATAFDAELHTDRAAARRDGVRQRISQRAVQNISSVGDASFVNSLQGRLLAFFDDFGYREIGISCELRNTVCLMGGLDVAPPASPGSGPGFTIVRGAGIPNLSVVGYNRLVDWPVLLERVAEIGKGNIKPVVQ
ncbi:MAG: hypothetical protein EPO30_02880 [Lysobacteraceae bacterium]|nr:MAG: hypothetical protein EPO30_02880 [Xanthomonadaceae bacterium]